MRALSLTLAGLTLLAGCSSGTDVFGRPGRDTYRRSSYPASARTTHNGQERYRVCHNGRTALTLPSSAVDAHLRHGDRFGSCSRRADRRDDRRDDRRESRGKGHGTR